MFLAFGLAFEVPIVVIVLARMGIVTMEQLQGLPRLLLVLASVVAAHGHAARRRCSQLSCWRCRCACLYEVGIWAAQIFMQAHQGARKRPAKPPSPERQTA